VLWQQFRDFPAHGAIPEGLVQRIWQEIGEALTQPITLEDLRIAIRLAPSSSVPGPNSLSYAMMKEWPDAVLVKAHKAVKTIWDAKIIPESWNRKWLCPKPKVDPEEFTLKDLRLLNLLETPWKILMGIVVKRIISIWERRGILCDCQYGFRGLRSCEGPTH